MDPDPYFLDLDPFFLDPDPVFLDPYIRILSRSGSGQSEKLQSRSGEKDPDPKYWQLFHFRLLFSPISEYWWIGFLFYPLVRDTNICFYKVLCEGVGGLSGQDTAAAAGQENYESVEIKQKRLGKIFVISCTWPIIELF